MIFKYVLSDTELLTIKGLDTKTVQQFLLNYPAYQKYLQEMPAEFRQIPQASSEHKDGMVSSSSDILAGKIFLITGFRDTAFQELIVANGGTLVTTFNTRVNTLIVKDLCTVNAKTQKASQKNVDILNKEGLLQLLKRD